MKTNTGSQIIVYISKNQQSTVKELVDHFGFSPQAIQRQLKKLIESEKLTKVGSPPRVYYMVNHNITLHKLYDDHFLKNIKVNDTKIVNDALTTYNRFIEYADDQIKYLIQETFATIINGNQIVEGIEAFKKWCFDRKVDIHDTANSYNNLLLTLEVYRNKFGLIEATHKFQTTFHPSYLDKVYYIDFYSIERFGKTKIGTYILYAKQSQSIQLMKEVFKIVDEPIMKLIKSEKIDAVGFIPPSISRKIQFMTELKRMLSIELPEIKITKIKSTIVIAQKTLNKLSDREENARNTMFVEEKRVFKNILLIDDAVGSGATFNEVAKKIRERCIVTGKIIGLGLTGSPNGIIDDNSKKGFPIINEV